MTTPRPAGPAPQGLYYSFEKAGLTLDRQPIPWNAEAVTVEAVVRAVTLSADGLADFGLFIPGGPRIGAETFRPGLPGRFHIFFRIAVPPHTMPVEVRVRDRSLGQVNLPLLTWDEFRASLKVTEPTVHVRLKDGTHACQSYVTTQAKEVIASMLLSAPTSLAPLADFDLGANLVSRDNSIARHTVRLDSNQLAGRQALVVVPFAKPPGRIKEWDIYWTLGQEALATRAIRGCTLMEFFKSLRISTTRLYLEGSAGALPLARVPPQTWTGVTRLGPVFLVSSGIAGMAAMAEFRVRVLDRAGGALFEMPILRTLVTDGPTVIAPGTLACDPAVESFELWCGSRRLGVLPLSPAPVAVFTGEGGIAARKDDFAWSPQAEEQLQQKLSSLLGGL